MPSGVTAPALPWPAILLLITAGCRPAPVATAPPRGPLILIDDVTLFYRIYDAAGGHPTADQLDHSYLARGSDGLRQFAALRNVSCSHPSASCLIC